jgi:oxygen-dependent protoporphyrinogen oxidase
MGTVREDVTRVRGLAVAGAMLDGVGIPACIASGRAAARTIEEEQA